MIGQDFETKNRGQEVLHQILRGNVAQNTYPKSIRTEMVDIILMKSVKHFRTPYQRGWCRCCNDTTTPKFVDRMIDVGIFHASCDNCIEEAFYEALLRVYLRSIRVER